MIYQKILKCIKKTVKKPSTAEIPEWFTDVLSKCIDYKIETENIPVFDIIAGIEDATKALPSINTSNLLWYCNILKKSWNKSETNFSEEVYRDINKRLSNNDLCLLEAEKGRATCIINRKQVHKMAEQELNKRIRYRKLWPGTIKQSRDAINKKIAKLKLKDLTTKQEHSRLNQVYQKHQKPDQYSKNTKIL